MLARRDRSRAEIAAALAAAGHSASAVRRAVGRLAALGYLDDDRLARERVERLAERGYGRLRMRAELERAGLEPERIERVLPGASEERRLAKVALDGRFAEAELRSRAARERAHRWLAGRGFSAETVDTVVDLWDE